MRRARMILVVAVLTWVAAACGKKASPAQPTSSPPATNPATRNDSSEPTSPAPDTRAADLARNRSIVEERIHFGYDRSDLTDMAQGILRAKANVLRADGVIRIVIEGHADERGSVEYNLALGLRRANAARDFLAGFGIDGSRIEVRTLGEDRPLDRRQTEEAYAQNRRAEFVITAGLR